MRQAAWTHHQVHQRVHAVMTAAMRADAHAIEIALGRQDRLDPHSRQFAVDARRLVLACTAALTCVMAAHRPGDDPHGREICRGCVCAGHLRCEDEGDSKDEGLCGERHQKCGHRGPCT